MEHPNDQSIASAKIRSLIAEKQDCEDQSLWKKLIDSDDPKDKETLNSIVIKIIDDKNDASFTFLLNSGYKIDVLNEKGQSALHYAFYKDRHSIIRAYLKWQPFPNDNFDLTDSNGLTHLHIVCHENPDQSVLEIVKIYLKNGSDVNACYHSDQTNQYSESTPLHFAVKTCKFDVVELLLENGAKINVVDAKGLTPLHLACQLSEKVAREKIELFISRYHADIDAKNQCGDTPLLSVFNDYPNIEWKFCIRLAKLTFDVLMRHGANILAKNNNGDTILHLIIKTLRFSHCNFYLPNISFDDIEHAELVEQILESNNELLEIKNSEGKTPLQLAVSMASTSVVKVLLDHKADTSSIKMVGKHENIFCYPQIVPNFGIIRNIMNIIDLLAKEEFEFSLDDNLMIIKFLVHEVDVCECSWVDCELNIDFKANTAIQFGAGLHAKQVLSQMIENGLAFDDGTNDLPYQLLLMNEASFYMDKELEEILNTFPRSDGFILNEKAKKELASLKSDVKLENGVKLYDLMLQHPFKASRFFKEGDFDCKLIKDFVQFRDIILGFVTKAIVRNYIVKTACDFFAFTPLSLLPELCFEKVLSFLSNIDIFNLCATALLKNSHNVNIAIQNSMNKNVMLISN